MPTSPLNRVVHRLRRAALRRDGAGLTDGQLLGCFVERRDETAFEALVRRHGPMVLGVCRRVLRHHHDAEDAFQAAFLVLAKKAGSVVPREMVGNWLYGVAYHTARKARALSARRRAKERQVAQIPEPEASPPDPWPDLQPLLDQELSRLPDRYRVPVVLCDLEGQTRKEAAQRLGWPEGTLSSRLARGRALLAKRLARRGLVLSGGLLAGVLAQGPVSAGVRAALVANTVKAAALVAAGRAAAPGVVPAAVAALAEGVTKSMLLAKLKITTAVLLGVALLGIAASLRTPPARAEGRRAASDRIRSRESGPTDDTRKNTITVKNAYLQELDARHRALKVAIRKNNETAMLAEEAKVNLAQAQGDLEVARANLALAEKMAEAKGPGQTAAKARAEQAAAEARLKAAVLLVGRQERLFRQQETRLEGLAVAKDAQVWIGKKRAKLSDLKAGMRVSLQLAADGGQLVVTGIRAED